MGDSLDFVHAKVDVGSLRFFVIAATGFAACFLVAMSHLKAVGNSRRRGVGACHEQAHNNF